MTLGSILIYVLVGMVGLTLHVLIPRGLYIWGRGVAGRQGNTTLWRLAVWVPVIGFGVFAIGVLWSLSLLPQVFQGMAAADPSQKEAVLKEGLSHAMGPTYMLAKVAWAFYGSSVVLCLVGAQR